MNKYWTNLTRLVVFIFMALSINHAFGQSSERSISAAGGWQNTGIHLTSGQSVTIESTGTWSHGYEGVCCGPNPYDANGYRDKYDEKAYLPSSRVGALIARIDGGSPIFVGTSRSFSANQTGTLQLSINDIPGGFSDNSGQLTVRIQFSPSPTQRPPDSSPSEPLPTCSVQSFNVSPTSGSRGTTFSLSGKGDCNTGVRAIRFKIDGGIIYELGSPEVTHSWNSSGASEGTHTATIEVAGRNDNDWRAAAQRSIQFTVGSQGNAPVQPQPPTPSQPQPISNNWNIGNTVYLCLGTEIRNGSGLQYAIHTVVPENQWPVNVINGPRQADGYTWWDIRRADGGSGWVRQDQGNCQPTSGSTNPTNQPDNIPIDYGSSSPIGRHSLQVHASPFLNIRSGPDASSERIGKAGDGGFFEIVSGPQNGWFKIRFSGGEGWVSGDFIEIVEPNPEPIALDEKIVPFSYPGLPTLQLRVLYNDASGIYLIDNGAEVVMTELKRFERELLDSGVLWFPIAFGYFIPSIGDVEALRINIENTVCGTGNTRCIEQLKYKIGDTEMDTSGLGNIIFGYITTVITTPEMETYIAEAAQLLKPETFGQSEFEDDIIQREVGARLAESVYVNGEGLNEATLIRVAQVMSLR